ncbi:MAG: AAA family ATPase [Deltaproteobacteria bacterium]|nr:AAA family ATPase [Deltaproteobacteria bacterium]
MYEEFYGLKERPFRKTPDPRFLFMSGEHSEALARMQYGVEERELVLVTGDIGTGKTTLSRALIDSLDESFKPILIINPRLSPTQFLKLLARRLGIESPSYFKSDLIDEINDILFKHYESGICPVIIIDEAQLIPGKGTFDEIRLLTNCQLDDQNLFSLLLVGQPELRTRLARKHYEPLLQRVSILYHLKPLDLKETASYIEHRLKVAGREEALFTKEAVEEIFKYSGGVPRIINNIASNSLLEGFGKEADIIDKDIVFNIACDMQLID